MPCGLHYLYHKHTSNVYHAIRIQACAFLAPYRDDIILHMGFHSLSFYSLSHLLGSLAHTRAFVRSVFSVL